MTEASGVSAVIVIERGRLVDPPAVAGTCVVGTVAELLDACLPADALHELERDGGAVG